MARAITWQDVVAPNQAGNLLAAQAAGKQITDSLSGLGGVATDIRNTAREQATRQAVASIQNAADPTAAAAALPQDWSIDPLAVANASNTRGQQLLQNTAAQASIDASKVSTQTNQAQLENIVADREAAKLTSAGIDLYRSNKGVIPSKDQLTKAGWDFSKDSANKAYTQLLGYDGDQQRLALEKVQAAAAAKALKEAEATKAFQGKVYDFNASGQAKTMAPNEVDNVYRGFAKELGLSSSAIPAALQYAQAGASQAVPSLEQRVQFNTPLAALTEAQQAAKLTQATAKAEFDAANATAEVMAKSPFADKTEAEIRKIGGSQSGLDETDFGQRMTAAQNRAAKFGGTLTPAQAADVARLNPTGFLHPSDKLVWSDASQNLMDKYIAFNKLGPNGLSTLLEQKVNPAEVSLSRLQQQQARLEGAILTGKPIPDSINAITKDFVDRNTKAAEKQKKDAADAAQKVLDEAARRKPSAIQEQIKSITGLSGFGSN